MIHKLPLIWSSTFSHTPCLTISLSLHSRYTGVLAFSYTYQGLSSLEVLCILLLHLSEMPTSKS